ncbi:MAG: hypothetical protein RIQ88_83 [Actinomycetota bacterium]|jgi:cytochrome oxidase assembly protein ShyY1
MLKLALTPKWLAALVACLALGAVFASLAQWQISRSIIPQTANDYSSISYQDLDAINPVGKPNTFQELDSKTRVLTEATTRAIFRPSKAALVTGRFQLDGTSGSWLVIPAEVEDSNLFIAVGFISDSKDAGAILGHVRKQPETSIHQRILGRYLPSEGPEPAFARNIFSSFSVAQLLNENGTKDKAYSGFMAITRSNPYTSIKGVDNLTIGLAKADSGLNWLSAFYALEWTFFALFSLFMWWRLLADSYKKLQEELLEKLDDN